MNFRLTQLALALLIIGMLGTTSCSRSLFKKSSTKYCGCPSSR